MKLNFTLLAFLLCSSIAYSQTPTGFVGINTSDPKAALQINSSTSGLMIPKYATLALANANSLPTLNAADHTGMMLYITEAANQGFWYYNGTAFVKVTTNANTIYNTDGAVTANRIVDLNNKELSLTNGKINMGLSYNYGSAALLNIRNKNAPGIKVLSDAFDGYTSIELGLLNTTATIGVSGGVGNFVPSSYYGDLIIRTEALSNTLFINNGNAGGGLVLKANKLGLGVETPTEKLDVNGTVKATGLALSTNPAAGAVLISDAAGAASWSKPVNFRAHGLKLYNYTGQRFLDEDRGFKTIDFENNSTARLAQSNWDSATGTYSIPVTGVYHFDLQVTIGNTIAEAISSLVRINVNGEDVTQSYDFINMRSLNGIGVPFKATNNLSTDLFLNANDKVKFKIDFVNRLGASNAGIETLENNLADFINIRLMR